MKGKGGTEGQRDGGEKKNMRINRKINDAANPSGKQSAQKKNTPESWTHTNIQAFSAN